MIIMRRVEWENGLPDEKRKHHVQQVEFIHIINISDHDEGERKGEAAHWNKSWWELK